MPKSSKVILLEQQGWCTTIDAMKALGITYDASGSKHHAVVKQLLECKITSIIVSEPDAKRVSYMWRVEELRKYKKSNTQAVQTVESRSVANRLDALEAFVKGIRERLTSLEKLDLQKRLEPLEALERTFRDS